MLRHFGHTCGAACVEIARHAILLRILELQRLGLLGHLCIQVFICSLILHAALGADQWHDHFFQSRQIAVQIHFQNGFDVGRQRHGLGGFVGYVSFGERPQCDDNFRVRLAQDRTDLFCVQQRVDRVHDPRNRTAQKADDRLVRVWQDIRHHVIRPDTQRAEQVGCLNGFVVKLLPAQRFGVVFWTGEQLIAHCIAL